MELQIALVGAGAMGSALGANWQAGGAAVGTVLAGRSARTRALAADAGLTVLDSLDDVVRAETVVSVVPPAQALPVARELVSAARRTGTRPLVVDLNAVAPRTMTRIARALGDLELVDGSISGPPPTADHSTRVYLSGPSAERVAALPAPWLDVVTLGPTLGTASALKMCTASMYKGTKALVLQAMLTAQTHGVLAEFLADVTREWPDDVPGWPRDVALAAAKSARFVDEMHEIATTQGGAGVSAALFDGVAAAYARVATTPGGRQAPEDVPPDPPVEDVLAAVAAHVPYAGVLFDFSGTLFHVESPAQAALAALGPDFASWGDRLAVAGAINGSSEPADLPDDLAEAWATRDLSAEQHRLAYSGMARRVGLDDAQADALYERGVQPDAWHPYPGTLRVLRELRTRGVPVAIVSNIGWDPRPVFERYDVHGVDALVLSYEHGVQKPDAGIFALACEELGVDPARCVMVGDNPGADGGATALGIHFEYVPPELARRDPETLFRAVGLEPPAPRT